MIHVHRFSPGGTGDSPDTDGQRASVLLMHGFMDAGGTWSAVAARLCTAHDVNVIAPDFRGFGQSDRVCGGGYYHFADYVADTNALLNALACPRITVVGHSMGGTVACYFVGANAAPIDNLVLLEGVGPPNMGPALGPSRMQAWLEQLQRKRKQAPLASLDDAVSRLAANHPRVGRDKLRELAAHLTVTRDDQLHWAFDTLHRTTGPSLFRTDAFDAFLGAITCPVMFVSGGPSGWHPPDESDRLAAFPKPPKQVLIPDAGHMMHWTRPVEVADAIAGFVAEASGR